MIELREARWPDDAEAIRELFREYQRFLNVDLCFQSFEEELAGLPRPYARPEGNAWLATADGQAAGCVAIKPLEPGVCEMKRLFVRPAVRGTGAGRRLAEVCLEWSASAGYQLMRLDTLTRLRPALALYQSLGFQERSAYYANPLEGVVYMERPLSKG
jgi:GNAT superfamily N-acetyltransferase